MDKIILSIIFMGLGMSLHFNEKKAGHQFEESKRQAVLASAQAVSNHFIWLKRLLGGILALIILYLLIEVFIPLSQTPLLVLVLVYLCGYYCTIYMVHDDWFFDKKGLWSSHMVRSIGFENIVSYECRSYGEKLILRVRYKGRGIMLTSGDFLIKENQKQAVTKLLNTYMAGM